MAPRANLYGDNDKLVSTHFGGPTWQAKDGSTVVSRRVNGVSVEPTAIPWLLLSAVSMTPGADGGRLADTTYIQRTATSGGLAPSADESDATTAGATAEVPYPADYHFWEATEAGDGRAEPPLRPPPVRRLQLSSAPTRSSAPSAIEK